MIPFLAYRNIEKEKETQIEKKDLLEFAGVVSVHHLDYGL